MTEPHPTEQQPTEPQPTEPHPTEPHSTEPQQRVIDLSVEVPGTPEQVWQAIATGPGISSWFVPRDVAEHEGGTVTTNFGDYGAETGEVAAWEPPHRVVFTSRGERPLAYEWLVEARDGGTCVVRLVNSGFGAGADWDDDYDALTDGWKIFLANLRLHLTRFPGQRARAIIPVGTAAGPNAAAFTELCSAFGVPDDLRPGDPFATSGAGVPALTGTVADTTRLPRVSVYLLLLDSPAPGTGLLAVEGNGEQVTVSTYLYLYGDAAAALGDPWTPFLAARFPGSRPVPADA